VGVFGKGDLVRWVIGHATFAAYDDRLEGVDPIYKYGIVVQVSKLDPDAIIVHSYGNNIENRLIILNGNDDDIEILSKGGS
jgi:hypothetical protein